MKIIKFFTEKYPYIHQLQTIYIDKQTRNIYVDVDTPIYKLTHNACFLVRWVDILWMYIFGTFKINSTSAEQIHNIVVETRSRNNCLCKCQMES